MTAAVGEYHALKAGSPGGGEGEGGHLTIDAIAVALQE